MFQTRRTFFAKKLMSFLQNNMFFYEFLSRFV